VEFGTNDHDTLTPQQTAANIGEIVSTLHTRLPESQVLVLGLLPGRTRMRTAFATNCEPPHCQQRECGVILGYVTFVLYTR
jgi:hypothetical protein